MEKIVELLRHRIPYKYYKKQKFQNKIVEAVICIVFRVLEVQKLYFIRYNLYLLNL